MTLFLFRIQLLLTVSAPSASSSLAWFRQQPPPRLACCTRHTTVSVFSYSNQREISNEASRILSHTSASIPSVSPHHTQEKDPKLSWPMRPSLLWLPVLKRTSFPTSSLVHPVPVTLAASPFPGCVELVLGPGLLRYLGMFWFQKPSRVTPHSAFHSSLFSNVTTSFSDYPL